MSRAERDLSSVGDRVLLGRLERPRTESPTRLAVVGDPHVATRAEGTSRVFHRTEERLRTAVDDLNGRDVDAVVFPGDLTKDGEPWNHDRFESLLTELDPPSVVTPGNHDLQKRGDEHECPSPSSFATRYGTGSLPARYEIGPVDLFVLNSAAGPDGPYVDTHRGFVSDDQLAWLDDGLESAAVPIVACHHNVLPLVSEPLRSASAWRVYTMRGRERVRSVLDAHDVALVLGGHHHLPALVKRRGLAQLVAPAVASYPQAYCLLEIDADGTSVWLVSHADAAERAEAYREAAAGAPIARTLLGLTESILDDCPLLYEPTGVADDILTESVARE
ncbi:metallophosphoesterase family protein [Halosolutus gelatinilyticus]|uniref:metallophosphoesterase family protein n=1 Tax=Halosolutus gelatinilyticus TaxID=2931975 RepID=UPI001FF5EF8E|nr:metallophosphoesterase [Halosolutus gelatinilyticus]